MSTKKKQVDKSQKPIVTKTQARERFASYQRFIALSFIASSAFGIYLLSTDLSLWILAVSHAYGLIGICIVDICLAAANFLGVRKALIPSTFWAFLTIILQLGDIVTAPQYKMTMQHFASYLFGLWAFDALIAAQASVITLTLLARQYARLLVKKKRLTYFDMGFKNSRRDFLQIGGVIVGLVALTGILGALEAVSTPNQSSPNNTSGGGTTSNLPSGAVANINDLAIGSPVYFQYPSQGYPCVVVKNSDGSLTGLSLLCTHVCCQCNYDSSSKRVYCPCHGSIFDQSGNVLQGPAAIPLPKIQFNVDSSGNVFPVKVSGSSPCLSG